MFRFNPYNFTITIDEQVQPPGIPADWVNKNGLWVAPGDTKILGKGANARIRHRDAAGEETVANFNDTKAEQQAPIQFRVGRNILANRQANAPVTPAQRQAMMATALAKRARQNRGTGANPGTPPVYPPAATGAGSPPPLPPPPTGGGSPPPLPPPPTGTSTGISARRQKADTVVGGLATAFSSIGGSTNRRPDRFGDPGRLIQGLYDAGKVAYDYMKTPGTPGSAATATSPAVAATPGRFDPRAGGIGVRAGVGAIAGTMVGGPVGGLIGAGIGALTGRRKPIPEERYYRVYKMISQHDHR